MLFPLPPSGIITKGPERLRWLYMKTILLVEDEEMLRNLVRDLLVAQGFQVLEARHGMEALSLMKSSGATVDLILTDVVMPQMSGTELVDRVRSDYPSVKVIFMSGYTGKSNASIHKLLETPGVAFLQKPFRLNALINQVETQLEVGSG